MRIKIANTIHDTENKPVMLIFDNTEERVKFCNSIMRMANVPHHQKHCMAPKDYDKKKLAEFMKLPEDEHIKEKYGKRGPGEQRFDR